ncbi:MAG: hypothetical protein ACPLN0_04435 [Candidatus Hydrothermia bacterium]
MFGLILLILSFNLKASYKIPYGPETIGILVGKEVQPMGPYSFTVTSKGEVIIPDPVNGKIKMLKTNGELTAIAELKGYFDDIEVDEDGKILVLDRSRMLLISIDPQTKNIEETPIDPDFVLTPAKLRKYEGSIYLENIDLPHLIDLKTKNTTIQKPVQIELNYSEKLLLNMISAEKVSVKEIPIMGVVSAEWLGNDKNGNIYIQIERATGETSIELQVLKFDKEGKLVETLTIPENNYYLWTSRLLYVDSDGRVYQMLPLKEMLKINIWE